MTKIEFVLKSLIFSCLFFVGSGIISNPVLASPRLYFDPASYTSANGTDFQINLKIDTENKSAFGADAVVNFPSNDLTVKSVANGGFFSDFSFAQSSGKLEVHGFFSALYDSKNGSGTFAVLTFSPNKSTGTGIANFTCSGDGNDTEILDTTGQNILSCNSLNQLNLSYSSTTTSDNGSTNVCGGTCGSNYNCNSGLFCYQGFCRNPDCRSDLSCKCRNTPSPSPTTKSKPTLKPTISPTPEIITLIKYSPYPSSTPYLSVDLNPASTSQKLDLKKIGIWGGAGLFAVFLILGISKLFKNKNNPPTPIQPPSIPPTF